MSTFEINDHILTKECDDLAREIFDDVMTGREGENPEDKRGEMDDRAYETADGHEWTLYTHKALPLCTHCDTSFGDEFLADVGMPEEPNLHKLACMIAFGEMRGRIMEEIDRLIEEWEPAEDEEADA